MLNRGMRRMYEVILKRFDHPDEIRTFEKGKFELIHLGGMTIGRASYQPGWRWSIHVGAMDDGRIIEIKAGDLFLYRSRP
jgi:hypothetical protein